MNVTIDSNGKQTMNGDYRNYSKYIRVECSAEGSFPITKVPFAHDKYYNPIFVGTAHGIAGLSSPENIVPPAIFSTGSGDNTSSNSTKFSGIDLETALLRLITLITYHQFHHLLLKVQIPLHLMRHLRQL